MLRRCTPRNDAERNNIAFKGLDVVRQHALKLFETAESGVDKVVSSCEKNPSVHWMYINFLRQRKTALDAPLSAVSAGRSMIEMLGVLAIIGVLSVGGIAGYSKAMTMFKINKMISEYSYLIINSLEYKDSLLKNNPKTGAIYLSSFFQDANLVPASWVMNGSLMVDSVGNNVQPYLNNSDGAEFIVMDVYLRTTSKGTADFAYNSCIALFNNIAKPLSEYFVGIFANSGSSSIHYDGTSSCHNEKSNFRCLTDMTLADADEACKKCLTNSNNCQVVMVW